MSLKTARRAAALPLLLALAACAEPAARHYYTLTYPSPKALEAEPFPYTIRVKELGISSTYSGDQLVFRQDAHELQYYKDRRWTERPGQMISDAVRRHLRQSGLVAQVIEKMREKPPDFVLEGDVEAVEELAEDEESSYARLAITLRLVRFSDDAVVWRHSFDARRRVPGRNGRNVVRAMSGLLEEQMNVVVARLSRHFAALARGEAPAADEPPEDRPAPIPAAHREPSDGRPEVTGFDPASPLQQHPQLLADETDMPAGKGAVFLPALSDSDLEPPVAIYRGGELVAEGRMGRRVVVPPGSYEVRFGSGARSQQRAVKVAVEEGRVTAVEPGWAALQLRVVDERFIPFRGSYELISMPGREEFGLGFGADEELGERPRIWVLEPGLYKVVQSGGTYRDRTNFATVYLEPGKLTRFVLVADQASGDFKGAGVVAPEDEAGRLAGKWKTQAIVGGDVKVSHGAVTGEEGWSIDLGLYFDGLVRYLDDPHFFSARLELEEGQLLGTGERRFEPLIDRLYAHSIYIYQLNRWLGPYARAGGETKVLPRWKSFDEPRSIEQVDENGAPARRYEDVEQVRLGTPFSPLQLKEGLGGNLRLLRSLALDLDVRAGVGARQYFPLGELAYDSSADRIREVSGYQLVGFEGAVVGLARLSRWVILGTELDALVPFDSPEMAVLTWRNQVSVRLVSFVSLNLLLNFTRDPNRGVEQVTAWENLLQLRFSYGLL